MYKIIFSLLIVSLLASCAVNPSVRKEYIIHSSLYNLSTGEVIKIIEKPLASSGRTIVTSTSKTKKEETFKGEFTTISNRIRSNTNVHASTSYGWANGSVYTTVNGQPTGSGVLVGNKGTVIEIVYRMSGRNADGEGRDNQGIKYKLQCCRIEYLKKK